MRPSESTPLVDFSKHLESLVDKLPVKGHTSPVRAIKSRGGIQGRLTEIRARTAEMLGKPIVQIARLTKGWNHDQLYDLYQECQRFVNPGALWWIKYKKLKQKYGQETIKTNNQRGLRQMGSTIREKKQAEGQGVLFSDW